MAVQGDSLLYDGGSFLYGGGSWRPGIPSLVGFALADTEEIGRNLIWTDLMSSNWSVLKLIKRLFAHLNYSQDQPPSLASLVTEQSCLTLDKINPGRGEVQWLKPPPRDLKFNYFQDNFLTVCGEKISFWSCRLIKYSLPLFTYIIQ